jgi:hypothetical protein
VVPDDRCTEKREESCGASQILTPDGARVLGRAMGMSTRGDGAQLWWLGHGREEKGRNGYGMAAGVCFEKRLGSAGREGKRVGSAWTRPHRGRRRRRGGPWRGGRQRGAASNGPRPSGDAVTWAKVADEGDQGEAGLGGSG